MRFLMLLALPLLLVSCDSKEEAKPSSHGATPAASADKAKDPICGMFVEKAKAIKHTQEGADYYFCSDGCLAKFKADPKKYAVPCTCAKTAKKCDCGHCAPKGETCDCHS
jgi:YHS domain-containing protein